jgi:hypothetical protein
VVDDPEEHLRVADVEVVEGREEVLVGLPDDGHVDVVEPAARPALRLVGHPHAQVEVGHRRHRPSAPRPVAPVVPEQRLVRDPLPEVVELLGVALELLLCRELGPELEVVAIAHGHVDELPGGIPLDDEVVGRDHVQHLADLAADALQVGGVQLGPLVGILEEAVDGAVRRGQGQLEAHALGHGALVTQALENRVGLRREAGVGQVVEADLVAGLDAPEPEALEILGRRLLGVLVGLLELVLRRGHRLLEVRVLREHDQRQHPDPVDALAHLTVGQPADVSAQPGAGRAHGLLRSVERQAADEQHVAADRIILLRAHVSPLDPANDRDGIRAMSSSSRGRSRVARRAVRRRATPEILRRGRWHA